MARHEIGNTLVAMALAAATLGVEARAASAPLPAPAATKAKVSASKPATGGGPAATAPPVAAASATAPTAPTAASDSGRAGATAGAEGETLKGEGTVFRSLTVQGDDRIHLEVERPSLDLDLDPQQAPGLSIGDAAEVLERSGPDLVTPLMSISARSPAPYVAQPWLERFSIGEVAHFRPEFENVERWRLTIADSRGVEVARFEGHGKPPGDLAWNGRAADGTPALPGRTYSYAFEAWDRAGNRRNFVGRGFSIAAYQVDGPAGPVLLFSGRELDRDPAAGTAAAPSLIVEAASRLHQAADPTQPLRVTGIARSADRAGALAERVARALGTLMVGDPARIRPVVQVEADAPEDGVVRIEFTH
jgi:hypothetical protein